MTWKHVILMAGCFILAFLLAACGVETSDQKSDPDLSLDLRMLHFDGVVSIQNNGLGNAHDLKLQFGVKPDWETENGLSDQASYLDSDKLVEYFLGDLPAGETLELDISGLLHQRWDGLDENVRLVYAPDGQDPDVITVDVSDVETWRVS